MRLSNIIGILSACFVFVGILLLSHLMLKWLLAIICSLLTFFLYKFLVSDDQRLTLTVPGVNSTYLKTLFWPCSLFLLGLTVILVPNMNYVYRPWSEITLLHWFRLIAAFTFTAFLPGYSILKIIDRNRDILGSRGRTIMFSYFLSIFFTSLIGYVLCLLGKSIEIHAPFVFLFLNLALFMMHQTSNWMRKKEEATSDAFPSHARAIRMRAVLKCAILCCIIAFWFVNGVNIQLEKELGGNLLTRGPDESFHNFSLIYLKGFPFWQFYVYWHHIYTAGFLSVSGLPTVNAFVCGEVVFGVIPIIAFYLMISAFFGSKSKIPTVATIFASFFQGFGWIYANPLYPYITNNATVESRFGALWNAGWKTYDVYMGTQFFTSTFSTLFLVGLPAFMMLVYLVRSEKPRGALKYFFIVVITAEGYLSHIVEISVFVLLFLLFLILKFGFPKKPKFFSFSMLLGLILVSIIDLLSPIKYYTYQVTSEPVGSWLIPSRGFILQFSLLLIVTLLLMVKEEKHFEKLIKQVLSTVRFHSGKIIHEFRLNSFSIKNLFKKMGASLLVFLYGFSFVIWWVNLSELGEFRFGVEYQFIPIYLLPIRLGINGALALALGIYLLFQRKSKNRFGVFFAWAVFFIVVGRIMWLLGGLYSNEARFSTFTIFPLSVISSLAVIKIFSRIDCHSKKFRVFGSILLTLTIIAGSCSTIAYTELYSLSYLNTLDISPKEVEAFDYLNNNAPLNSVVLALSTRSVIAVSAYCGQSNPMAWPRQGEESQWKIVTESNNPDSLFSLIDKFNVKYVYAKREEHMSNEDVFGKLLQFLPVAFNNSEVTIFEVPSISSFGDSNFAIITPALLDLDRWIDHHEIELRYEELDSLVVVDDGQASFWSASSSGNGSIGIPLLTDDSEEKINGTDSLKITVGSGSYEQWTLRHTFSPAEDWSNKDFVCLYWYGTNSGKMMRLSFFDPTRSKYFSSDFSDSFIGWKHLILSKKSFREINSPSWGDIGMVYLYGFDNAQGTWRIDRFIVSTGVYRSGPFNASLVSDCDSTGGWEGSNLRTKIDESTGRQYIEAVSDAKGNYESRITLSFPKPQDFSEFDFLSLDIKCSSSEMKYYEVGIIDNLGHRHKSFWRINYDNPDSWKRILLPLSQPDGYMDEDADLSSVSLIQIKVLEPSPPINPTYGVDNIVVLKDTNYYNLSQSYFYAVAMCSTGSVPYSTIIENDNFDWNQSSLLLPYDPSDLNITKYTKWVQSGGQFIVLNSLGHGAFAKELSIVSNGTAVVNSIRTDSANISLPQLTITKIWSENNVVKTTAFYAIDENKVSPFAFTKRIGSGEIIYLELSSYFSTLDSNRGNEIGRDCFASLGDLINILNLSVPQIEEGTDLSYLDSLYDYQQGVKEWSSYAYDSINCAGEVQITSDFIDIVNERGIYVDFMNVSSGNNNWLLSEIILENVRVYGPLRATLSSSDVCIYPDGFGSYIYVFFANKTNLTIDLDRNARIDMKVLEQNATLSLSIKEKSNIEISGIQSNQGTKFIVKKPTISVQGQIMIDRPYFWPQSPRSWGEPMNITGNVSFQVDFAEKDFVYVSNFRFDGNVTRAREWVYSPEMARYAGYRSEVEDMIYTLFSEPGIVFLYTVVFALLLGIVWISSKRGVKITFKLSVR